MKNDLRKLPLLRAWDPFTGRLVPVRVIARDTSRRTATVIDPADNRCTIPFSWFVLTYDEAA